ncbi:hypothetical protein C8R44DRAFT_873891 [Mycena epipterygia]|nr:hypothetical protein C8R44DRAFT_873891 [Mycena epipterygia]
MTGASSHPLIDPRTGQEISEADLDMIFIQVWGSVEKGRQVREEYLRKAECGEIAVVGLKPSPGDPVTIFPVNNKLSFRLWDKRMETTKQFCFDFVDNNGNPVDDPAGIKVYAPASLQAGVVEHPEVVDWVRGGKIALWTMECGLGSTRHEQEKYLIQEGASLQIVQSDCYGRVLLERYITIPTKPRPGARAATLLLLPS